MILRRPKPECYSVAGYLGAARLPSSDPRLPLLGGRLALDFANIPSYPGAPAHRLSWEELIVFLEASRIVSNERGSTLLALSGSEPEAAPTLLRPSPHPRASLRNML